MRTRSTVPRPSGTPQAFTTAAVAAALRGWAVFPCRAGDKRPAIGHWGDRATANPAHIDDAWRTRFRGCNIGIACAPSGLVVIDLDTAEHGGQLPAEWAAKPGVHDGQAVLAVLADRAGHPLPATYTVRTPSSGLHLYFQAPPDREIRNSAGKAGPMIDVRGAGGYVVAAGSVVRGRPYELADDRPLALLPRWLADLVDPPRPGPGPAPRMAGGAEQRYGRLRGLVELVLTAEPGTRNSSLYWAACRAGELVAAGQVDQASAERALITAAMEAGLRGGEPEARRTVASGLRQGMTA